ncbi:MAG: hydroxyethylthiazole kinase [Alphaproteobacteria bacterium]|nr:hydroxyethylthiazole kinase [Alphaproteobacteria bacterium]
MIEFNQPPLNGPRIESQSASLLTDMLAAVENIRGQKPLVLNLTNVVTMDFMANALLAVGAAPLMSVASEEIAELVAISSAVNINIGTLDEAFIARAMLAASTASNSGRPIPLVLDPVGAGASHLRRDAALLLLPHVNIVRGNASEILALGQGQHGREDLGKQMDRPSLGVESTAEVGDALAVANYLANSDRTVVVSGEVDIITDGHDVGQCFFGTPLMKSITGMGCVLTAVIAAFRAVIDDNARAANLAVNFFGLVGQVAASHAHTPAAFRSQFIDYLYQPDWQAMEQIIKAQSAG